MRPTVQQLEAFLAVSRTLSFRQAAEQTFTSQSALSGQIKRLEEILGVKLFERDRRRTMLTPEGERARDLATRVLDDLDQLTAAMRTDGDPLAGRIRIGAIPTVAPFLIPRLVAKVRTDHPETQLLVLEEPTARLVSRLQDGELDAIVLDVDVELGSAKSMVLFEEALSLAVGNGHELAGRDQVTLDDLDGLDLLLLEEGHCLSDRIRSFCRSDQSEFGDFRATSLVTLVQMVAAGTGATLLPEMAARDFASVPGLTIVPFAEPAPSRRIGIAWRPTDARGRTIEALAAAIEACA
ncbi:MAG: hydrogen peroxide-inducible genes activator [Planctomycetes bacterium]|nr:hydrogen peroxide-inducible genes activator [Planctomycetota bacterium]